MASIIQINGRWRAQVRRKGHPAYTETFGTRAEADRWARHVETQIDAGRRPEGRAVMGRAYLLRDVVQDYRRLRAGARPVADDSNEHYQLKRLAEHLGERDALSLTVDDLVGFCRARAEDGAGPYTINMDVGKLGTVLRLVFGVKRLAVPDVVAQARPALSHLGLIGGGGRRERRPNDDELSALLDWMERERGRVYADVIRFAVATAMRRAEICRIVWEDVDAQRKLVLIRQRKHPRQKKSNDEWVPLLGAAWDLIHAQPTRQGPIFAVHPQTISKYFRDGCQALGIPDLQLRDMRHDGVSRLFEHGYQIQEVALVSGHKKWETLKRYTQLKPEDLHRGPLACGAPGVQASAVHQDARPRHGSLQSGASHRGRSESGTSGR
ncbi:MAG: site-specific integrase [Desulfovibrionaceae bacterium]|jgi:integrase|nr:site-specific integrase [Desulfovibrionaceae bacterium]